jgi:hypothetical protein
MISLAGITPCLGAKPLEYNVPVCIRSVQFNRSLVVRAGFTDIKATDSAAPFELVAAADDQVAAKDGSAFVVLKSAANPAKIGPVQFNEICTIEPVKAGTGPWVEKVGFFAKRRLIWTFRGSRWPDKDKDGVDVHYQPRVSDDTEPALKTEAINFAITSPAGKTGIIQQEDVVNLVSRATGASNNRMMWVINFDQDGVLPVLISSDDPWGRNPKSGLGGDRRLEAGKFTIGEVDVQLLNDAGWADLTKITQQGIAKSGGKYASGSKAFTYEPAVFGKGNVLYSEQWKAEHAGNLWVKWRAKAKSDVMVHISTQPKWMDAAGTYFILLGGYKNTRSQIRKGTQVVMEVNVVAGGDPSTLVSGGLPGNGSMWDDYWVSVEPQDGKIMISVGKGQKVGEQVKMTWLDEQPLGFVQYIGFGGLDSTVDFDKIVISGNEQTAQLPIDFALIPGNTMKAIGLGIIDGQALLLGITESGSLWQWDPGSLKSQPWNQLEVVDEKGAKIGKVIDIAAGPDGTVALINHKRRVYLLNREKKRWDLLSNKGADKKKIFLDRIALGNAGTLIGLDKKTKNIYFKQDDAWILLSEGEGLDIAAAFDGSIYALNTKQQLFSYDGKAWNRVETNLAFSMISAVSKDELYGIVLEGKKHKTYTFEKGLWEALQTSEGGDATGLKDILALPTVPHFVVTLDLQGNVYRKGEPQVQLGDVKLGGLKINAKKEELKKQGPKIKKRIVKKRLSRIKKKNNRLLKVHEKQKNEEKAVLKNK